MCNATFPTTQPARLELQSGPDRFYYRTVYALWLLAAAVVISQAQTLAWPLFAAAWFLLFLLRPGINESTLSSCQLYLYRNGTAVLGDQAGSWRAQSWSCRWYAMFRVDLPGRRALRILVCASHNSTDDYRRLLVWTRFPPFAGVRGWRRSRPS